MAGVFDNTMTGALGAVMASRGVAVTYWRGSDFVSVTATPAEERYLVDDGEGYLQQMHARDYLLAASDIDFGGGATPPARGDLIKETIGGAVHTYEVVALGGESHYRYMDPGLSMVRVHTKLVSQA